MCRELVAAARQVGRINFRAGSAELDNDSDSALEGVASALRQCPGVRVTIEGHTDDVGNPEANLRLSQRRAESLVEDLVGRGIARERLTAAGFGETRPVDSNATPEGRAANRRIDIILQ